MAYLEKITALKNKIIGDAETIAPPPADLELKLENYNLLNDANNCIQSSTAIGYILEEFFVTQLCIKPGYSRAITATNTQSYDCCFKGEDSNIKFLINVKVEKSGKGKNNAVAAISQLYDDYNADVEIEKSFVVFKIKYELENKKIHIKGYECYCLEEVGFPNGDHMQDNRNWGNKVNAKNNGRLIISNKWRNANKLAENDISYENTRNLLKGIKDKNNSQPLQSKQKE